MAKSVLLVFIVACSLMDPIPATRVEDFFPSISGNLTKLKWAHAVNNVSYLSASLQNVNVMMLEADIQLGTVSGGGSEIVPIMAHPPNTVSDLTLAAFLMNVTNHNQVVNSTNSTTLTRKGVKLDFKTIEAFNQSQAVITQNYNGSFPLWINADILAGPGNSTSIPVNATDFFTGAKALNLTTSTLSLGWTTALSTTNTTNSTTTNSTTTNSTMTTIFYTDTQVTEMINLVNTQNVPYNITFAVRAALVAESQSQMVRLVTEVPDATLTIWSSENDTVNVDNLRSVIKTVGVENTFLDVPEDLENQLRLDDTTTGGNGTTSGNNTVTAAPSTGSGAVLMVSTAFMLLGILILLVS